MNWHGEKYEQPKWECRSKIESERQQIQSVFWVHFGTSTQQPAPSTSANVTKRNNIMKHTRWTIRTIKQYEPLAHECTRDKNQYRKKKQIRKERGTYTFSNMLWFKWSSNTFYENERDTKVNYYFLTPKVHSFFSSFSFQWKDL